MSAWREATTSDGKVYFFNEETKETRWTPPGAAAESSSQYSQVPSGIQSDQSTDKPAIRSQYGKLVSDDAVVEHGSSVHQAEAALPTLRISPDEDDDEPLPPPPDDDDDGEPLPPPSDGGHNQNQSGNPVGQIGQMSSSDRKPSLQRVGVHKKGLDQAVKQQQHQNQRTGMVPSQGQAGSAAVVPEPGLPFDPTATRASAESQLSAAGVPPGTFLLRPSSKAGALSLSFRLDNGSVGHMLLCRVQGNRGWHKDNSDRVYPTCRALLGKLPVGLQLDGVKLTPTESSRPLAEVLGGGTSSGTAASALGLAARVPGQGGGQSHQQPPSLSPRAVPAIKSGWLLKKGKRRYFVLDVRGRTLYWFVKEHPVLDPERMKKSAQNFCSVEWYKVFPAEQSAVDLAMGKANCSLVLESVEKSEKPYELTANSGAEMQDWLRALVVATSGSAASVTAGGGGGGSGGGGGPSSGTGGSPWIETKTSDGKVYWFNSITKQSSWTKPE